MAELAWMCLALAVLTVPSASPVRNRVQALGTAGRLAPLSSRRPRRLRGAVFIAAPVLAIAVGCAVATVRAGALVGATMVVVCGLAMHLLLDVRRRRTAARHRSRLSAAVRILVAELEVGSGGASALDAAAEVAGPYAQVLRAAAESSRQGVGAAATLSSDATLRHLGLAWDVGERAGAPLAAVLERVADDMTVVESQRRSVAVALAGARASAGLMALLPGLGLAMGTAMGGDPVRFLLGSPAGRLVLCLGVLLDAAGVLWMRSVLHRAEAVLA
jgi:tight adherence protein B